MHNPDSLLAKTLKAKYFPRNSFFVAGRGYNLSSIWTAILESRKVLELGLKWVVGRGDMIKVWGDEWLGGELGRVSSDRGDYSESCTINAFMLGNGAGWNIPLIQNIFTEEEAGRIITLPFSSRRMDLLTWKFEKNGVYSVKSGYVEAMSEAACVLGYPR